MASFAAVEAAADGSQTASAVFKAAVVAAVAGSVWEAVLRTAADPETEQGLMWLRSQALFLLLLLFVICCRQLLLLLIHSCLMKVPQPFWQL